MKNTLILLFFCGCFILGNAQSTNADSDGGYAGEFLRWGVGARALAMGRAYTALAKDAYATYWNPAGLAYSENMLTVGAMYLQLFENTYYNYISTQLRLHQFINLGISVIGVTTYGIEQWDSEGERLSDRSVEVGQQALTVSYAAKLWYWYDSNRWYLFFIPKSLDVGLNVNSIDNTIFGSKVSCLTFDVGIRARYQCYGFPVYFGFKLQNLDDLRKNVKLGPDNLPWMWQLGIGLLCNKWRGHKFFLSIDLNKVEQRDIHFSEHFKFGLNFQIYKPIWIRGGRNGSEWTFGMGLQQINFKGFRFLPEIAFSDHQSAGDLNGKGNGNISVEVSSALLNSKEWYERAREKWEKNEAFFCLQHIFDNNEDDYWNVKAIVMLGTIYLMKKKWEKAEERIEEALKIAHRTLQNNKLSNKQMNEIFTKNPLSESTKTEVISPQVLNQKKEVSSIPKEEISSKKYLKKPRRKPFYITLLEPSIVQNHWSKAIELLRYIEKIPRINSEKNDTLNYYAAGIYYYHYLLNKVNNKCFLDTAIIRMKKVAEFDSLKNDTLVNSANFQLGLWYKKLEQYDSAKVYFAKVIKKSKKRSSLSDFWRFFTFSDTLLAPAAMNEISECYLNDTPKDRTRAIVELARIKLLYPDFEEIDSINTKIRNLAKFESDNFQESSLQNDSISSIPIICHKNDYATNVILDSADTIFIVKSGKKVIIKKDCTSSDFPSTTISLEKTIEWPFGIAIIPIKLYITDMRNGSVYWYDFGNGQLSRHPHFEKKLFNYPIDIAMHNNCFYILENGNNSLSKFNNIGVVDDSFVIHNCRLLYPSAFNIYMDMLYVLDWGNQRIVCFEQSGKFFFDYLDSELSKYGYWPIKFKMKQYCINGSTINKVFILFKHLFDMKYILKVYRQDRNSLIPEEGWMRKFNVEVIDFGITGERNVLIFYATQQTVNK